MRLSILALLLILFNLIILDAQTVSKSGPLEGEIMVQLRDGQAINRLMTDYRAVGLEEYKVVSRRFHIYLLKFNTNRTSNREMVSALKYEQPVLNVQSNHRISLRETTETLPNDSLFGFQWALRNLGQNGGQYGADIDATDAWDITTGGLTAHGDTIVVAVVDGGSDMNHEDLDLWKNLDEIPDNGIDDDSNGFVDDYDGWNAFGSNGDIPLSNHGIHVSGIVAARGDNEIGVTGVNWNTRIMPVAGASTSEATVVEALSYVYGEREIYDSTNGAKGAFVVAVNCSFGVDLGQPEDFPIWEAMYDSLGKLGVLNVAATANRAWDIDSVGDVPTAFETDYMISVTNTTNKDELYGNAAYGDTTIDLGAPGSLIRSLRINNQYGNSSGTSMATPHVAGAIALLLSAADSNFISSYKNNPAEYALKIKDYILNGTDTLETLVGKTVTGGRLNLFNSLNLLLDAPALTTNVDSLYAEIPQDDTAEDTLVLTNSGGDTLQFTLTILNESDWLSVNRTEGEMAANESDSLLFTFNSTGLNDGFYHDTVLIEGVEISPVKVPVTLLVFTNVGTEELSIGDYNVSVYPNPFTREVNFVFDEISTVPVVLEIYDLTGKTVFSGSRNLTGSTKITWNNQKNSGGIYFYRILSEGRLLHSGKLVQQ